MHLRTHYQGVQMNVIKPFNFAWETEYICTSPEMSSHCNAYISSFSKPPEELTPLGQQMILAFACLQLHTPLPSLLLQAGNVARAHRSCSRHIVPHAYAYVGAGAHSLVFTHCLAHGHGYGTARCSGGCLARAGLAALCYKFTTKS
eukprot:1153242-Pelagomonas_calceolata.AAC.3